MVIDITRLIRRTLKGYKPTGIDRVCIEYLNYFKDTTKVSIFALGKLWVFNNNISSRLIDSIVNLDKTVLKQILPLLPFNLVFNVSGDVFINVSHSGGLEHKNYFELLKKRKLKPVFMVHDLIPFKHPEFVKANDPEKHKKRMANIILSNGLIVTNSEQTKNELINYAMEELKINIKDNVEVNYLGVTTKLINAPLVDFSVLKKRYHLKDKYFVVLSTIEPRKNHMILMYVWNLLHENLKDKTPQLVLIGRRGWECEQILDFIERSRIKNFIIEINDCPDEELKTILINSQALLMPSIEEGFGLPVLEAIMLNVLTVCSNISVFIELYKDVPMYAPWYNASDWATLILEIISGKKDYYLDMQKQRLEKNNQYILRYTWDLHFQRLKNILYKHNYIPDYKVKHQIIREFQTENVVC